MKKRFLFLILVIMISQPLFSQDNGERKLIGELEESYKSDAPSWLLMERGKQAFALGELGLASRIFREILNREKAYPDAEIWLAYIFEQEGEYNLAEKQYLKALESKKDLYIIEDEYTVFYKLAEIYKKTNQYGKYENILLEIIAKDTSESGSMDVQYRVLDVLKQQGIDKMFELFRFKNERFSKARKELGIFYYQTGRYTEAEINLMMPVLSAATLGFDYIYKKTAVYEYATFEEHIVEMKKYREVAELLDTDNFFESMYYLAAALYADGYSEDARLLWEIVYRNDSEESVWRRRAARQLSSPYIEPIITRRS